MRFLLKDLRGFRVNEELSVCYTGREKTIVRTSINTVSLFYSIITLMLIKNDVNDDFFIWMWALQEVKR